MSTTTTPRVYVADLRAYNAGTIHGVHVELAGRTLLDIGLDVAFMLASSPVEGAEETALHDHEGFGGFRIDEHESLLACCVLADVVVELGPWAGEALADYNVTRWTTARELDQARTEDPDDWQSPDELRETLAGELLDALRDADRGEFDCRGDWAETLARDLHGEAFRLVEEEWRLPFHFDADAYLVELDAAGAAPEWLQRSGRVIDRDALEELLNT